MSWKKYGGLKNLDSNNNIAVNTLVTDTFTIRDKLLTEFQVTGDTQFLGDVLLGILDTSNNVTKTVTSNAHIIAVGNVDISGNTSVGGKLFLTPSNEGIFFKGTDSGKLGINMSSPIAILDISGSSEEILNVQSQLSTNRNIFARNNTDDGIAIVTTDVSSSIQFYNGGDITDKLNPDAEIKYTNNGILEIITDTDTRIFSSITISDDGRSGHLNNETMVIYDISDGTYRNLYYKDGTIRKGNAITVVSSDASSNTSIHIITPSGEGGTITGGAYPGDLTKSMLIMDVSNNSQIKAPAQMIVAGTNLEKYNTTISFNKFISQVDKYAVDINGATNITDNQTNIMEEPAKEILKMGFHGDHGYAIGSIDSGNKHMLYKTLNGGIAWTQVEFTYGVDNIILTGDKYSFKDIHINGNTLSLVVILNGESSFLFTTPDKIADSNTYGVFSLQTGLASTGNIIECVYGFTDTDSFNHFVVARATSIFLVNSDNGIDGLTYDNTNPVKDIDGISNVIFCVGDNSITKYTIDSQINTLVSPVTYTNGASDAFTSNLIYNASISINYKTVSVYNAMLAIAAGESGLSYTKDGGITWIDVSIPNLNANDIFIKSDLQAIIVGDGGNVYVTQNGCKTWNKVDDLYFNGSGISNYVLADISNNITSVYMPNDNTLITSHVNKQTVFDGNNAISFGESKLIHTHTPSLFNRNNTSVLDVVGTISVSGDIMFHDRGELKTTDASFGLLKTGTTEINFGLSGETIIMGSKTGLVDMNGRLQVADDVSMNSNLDVSGNTTMVGLLDVSSDVHFRSQLNVDGSANFTENLNISGDIILSNNAGIVTTDTTFGLLETVAETINFGLVGSTINVGASVSNVILNDKLNVKGDTLVNGSLTVDGSINFVGELVQTDICHNVLVSDQLRINNVAGTDIAFEVNQKIENKIADFRKNDVSKFYIESDGKVVATEDVSVNKALTSGGDIHVLSTTSASTVGAQAALYVEGGTKLVKTVRTSNDVYVGGKLYVSGEIVSTNTQTLGSLNVLQTAAFLDEGQAQLSGAPIDICGGALIHQNLIVKKNIETLESVISGGDISGNSNLFVGGDASLNSTLFVSGNIGINKAPSSSLAIDIASTTAIQLPMGTNAERNNYVSNTGQIRYNTDTTKFEGKNSGGWGSLGGVSNNDESTIINVDDSDNLSFQTNSIQHMSIVQNGDVSMNSNLNINGDININGVINANNAMIFYPNDNAKKIDFYGGTTYGGLYTLGMAPVTDYGDVTGTSVVNTMNNTAGYGWTWRTGTATPIMALGVSGNMKLAGTCTATVFHGDGSQLSGITNATQTALNLKAPIISPTFTGTVTSPTVLPADNSTKVATTAYVTNAVTAATTAISSTITNSLSNKLDISGGTITGSLSVDETLTVNTTGQNKFISSNVGIGNYLKSSLTDGRNTLHGGNNYIYCYSDSGQNRLYAQGTYSGNALSAMQTGGYNLLDANSLNALKIGGVEKIKTESGTTTLTNTNNYFYANFNRFFAGDGVTDTAHGQVFNQFQTDTIYGSNRLYANGINGYNLLYANGYNTIQSNRANNTANDINATGIGGRNIIRCNTNTGYTDIQIANNSKIKVENATTTLTNTNINVVGHTDVTGSVTINEATGSGAGTSSGTLVLKHGNNGGKSSIVFRSAVNEGTDHAYIEYKDNTSGATSGEDSKMVIGTMNDSDDDIILLPSGNVGIGTTDFGNYKLYVKGTTHVTGNLTTPTALASENSTIVATTQYVTTAINTISLTPGAKGDKGDKGDTGTSTTGATGAKGATGATGATGAKGATGATGATTTASGLTYGGATKISATYSGVDVNGSVNIVDNTAKTSTGVNFYKINACNVVRADKTNNTADKKMTINPNAHFVEVNVIGNTVISGNTNITGTCTATTAFDGNIINTNTQSLLWRHRPSYTYTDDNKQTQTVSAVNYYRDIVLQHDLYPDDIDSSNGAGKINDALSLYAGISNTYYTTNTSQPLEYTYTHTFWHWKMHTVSSGSSTTAPTLKFSTTKSTATGNSAITTGTPVYRAYISGNETNVQMNFTGQHHNYGIDETINEVGFIVKSTGQYRNQMSNCDECNKFKITINESLPIVDYCSMPKDKRVFGVISDKDDDSTSKEKAYGNFVSVFDQKREDRPLVINSLGEGAIWVTNINGLIENGDYITTCDIPGLGMRQDDDFLHSYTVAKSTMPCLFDENELVPKKKLRYQTVTKTREATQEVESQVIEKYEDAFDEEIYTDLEERQIIDTTSKVVYENITTFDASGVPTVQRIQKTIEEEIPRVIITETTDVSGNITQTDEPVMEIASVTKTRSVPRMVDINLTDPSGNNVIDASGNIVTLKVHAKQPVYKTEKNKIKITEEYEHEEAVIDPVTNQFVYDIETDVSGNNIYIEKYDMKYIMVSIDKYSIYNDGGRTDLYKEFQHDFTNTVDSSGNSIIGNDYKMAFIGCTYHCG